MSPWLESTEEGVHGEARMPGFCLSPCLHPSMLIFTAILGGFLPSSQGSHLPDETLPKRPG